jgi:hypothetical protein
MQEVNTILEKIENIIFSKQTTLAEIYESNKTRSIYDYSNSWSESKERINPPIIEIIKSSLRQIYGNEVAEGVATQLKGSTFVSTIDHHGFLNHPFFVNSNLIYSLKKDLKYLICFSTASISLNNSSWPGCFMVHQGKDLKRFSIFPDRLKTRAVLSTPSFTKEDVDALLTKIKRGLPDSAPIQELARNVLLNDQVLNAEDFSQQASFVSTALWAEFFPMAPTLVYLPLEDIVSRILCEIINNDSNNILHRIFYTQEGQVLLEKYFHPWLGAFSYNRKGSYLFWGLEAKGRRTHLSLQNGRLEGWGASIPFNPDSIKYQVLTRKMYPTSLTCFLVMLYYNFTCLGGFNQVNWLTDIQNRFKGLLREIGESEAEKNISQVPTKNFAESNLGFLLDKENQPFKATGFDMYLQNNPELFSKYYELAKQITVGESMRSMLPEIYRIVIPEQEREPELMELTDEKVLEVLGLEGKVRNVFNVSVHKVE